MLGMFWVLGDRVSLAVNPPAFTVAGGTQTKGPSSGYCAGSAIVLEQIGRFSDQSREGQEQGAPILWAQGQGLTICINIVTVFYDLQPGLWALVPKEHRPGERTQNFFRRFSISIFFNSPVPPLRSDMEELKWSPSEMAELINRTEAAFGDEFLLESASRFKLIKGE